MTRPNSTWPGSRPGSSDWARPGFRFHAHTASPSPIGPSARTTPHLTLLLTGRGRRGPRGRLSLSLPYRARPKRPSRKALSLSPLPGAAEEALEEGEAAPGQAPAQTHTLFHNPDTNSCIASRARILTVAAHGQAPAQTARESRPPLVAPLVQRIKTSSRTANQDLLSNSG